MEKIKNKESYNKEIKDFFLKNRSNILPDVTASSLKNRCLYLFNKGVSESDKNTLINFFDIKIHDDIRESITELDSYKLRAFVNYLNSQTNSLNNLVRYNFVAWLIGFKPRPYSKYIKNGVIEENINDDDKRVGVKNNDKEYSNIEPLDNQQKSVEINNSFSTKSKSNLNSIVVFAITAIIITLFGVYLLKNNTPAININNVNNNFKQITPTKDTQFFSEETGDPQVWYATYNNQKEFFNGKGYHPITNEVLRPVNRDIIRTFIVEKVDDFEEKENYEKNNISNVKTKFGIYNNSKLDKEFNIFFSKNFKKINLYNYTGVIEYHFRESSLNKKLFVCEINLNYILFSKISSKEIESNTVKVNGSGFTKQEAKQNAISNIKL